jgi:hypothetical protein
MILLHCTYKSNLTLFKSNLTLLKSNLTLFKSNLIYCKNNISLYCVCVIVSIGFMDTVLKYIVVISWTLNNVKFDLNNVKFDLNTVKFDLNNAFHSF